MSASPATTAGGRSGTIGAGVRSRGHRRGMRVQLALGTALASVVFAGYGSRSAFAGGCYGGPDTYNCAAGANAATDMTQILSGAPLTVTTVAGFGIDTSATGGDAFTLYGDGGLTFTDAQGSTITGAEHGIYAYNYAGGDLTITTNGQLTGVADDGVKAYAYGANMTISVAGVSGGDDGISVTNLGSGALTITATGQVTGFSDDGIDAVNEYGTDLTINAVGVSGGEYGIYALNYGSGALSVTATGTVTSGGGYAGVLGVNIGTSLTISTADVSGSGHGIAAYNFGNGALGITATGQVDGGYGYGGIFAVNVYGTDLTISAAGVNGDYDGITALQYGSGKLEITATGQVNGAYGDGVYAVNAYGTDLTVTTAGVAGADDGIHADNYGSGALTIAASGIVTGGNYAGIVAFNEGTDLTVTAVAVLGGEDGIAALNYGSGALSVTATGPVTGNGAGYDGIYALNYGTSLTVNAVDVSGADDAIDARNYGSTFQSITVSGVVAGGTGAGISTIGTHTDITLNAGADVGAASGLAISNDGGNSRTVVRAGAHVGGDVSLGDGSDDLTFDGGTFAATAILDGGDDTGIGDGFIDRLRFRNLAAAVTGGNLQNWENVFIESGASVSFSDNMLSTSSLAVVNGGVLDMDNGVADSFVLDGNLEVALGGSLVLDVFSETLFDSLLVSGTADFGSFGEILFNLDIDPGDLFDGFIVDFLTSAGVLGFGDLLVSYTGLDPLYTANVSELNGVLSLTLNSLSVPEAPAAALLGAGLLGLFGLGLVRRRGQPESAVAQ